MDQPAPGFQLKDLNGQLVSLSSYQGKPVFFNYWASWCPACVNEMPLIQAAYDDMTKQGLVMLMINAGEDLATAQNFVQQNHYTFPVLLDSQNDVGNKYNIYYIPVSVFVDKNGILRSRVVGAFKDKRSIEGQMATILK